MSEHHVATQPLRSKIVGGIQFGEERGLIENADLSSKDGAIAAVNDHIDGLHPSQDTWPDRVTSSLEKADQFQAGFTSGGDVDAIESISEPGDTGQTGVNF